MKEKWKAFYQRIKPYLNKYVIVVFIFLLIIVFLDKNNVIQRVQYKQEIRSLRRDIRKYEQERDDVLRQLEDLRTGTNELEKIARERYLMKRDNEEIFILDNE